MGLGAGGSAGGNATFDAGGTAALGQVLAGTAATLSVRALDAAITGIQRAGTVTFTNRAPTTTATRLGDGTAAGGFALSTTEVNFVEANQLTVNAGGGIRVPVNDRWGVRSDARWLYGSGRDAPDQWRIYNGATLGIGGKR